jgi:hypothetical protein
VCQASRLDAHLSRSGRAPARPGGHARRERTADVERGARSEERGARRTTDRAAHRRDRDALASRPTGRSAASRKGRGRAAVGGTACQASRLDAHLSPARCARHPASTRTSLEAAELLLGRAVTPGEAHRRRGAARRGRREDEERGARRTTDRAAHRRDRDALASRPTGRSAASRKGRGREAVGGTVCQASRLDAHLSPARCARHPASTRTSLEAAELLLGRAVTPGEAHRRRGARSEERGDEERGARRTTDRAAHRRDRDALASRPTGRSAASRKGRGRAAVGGTVCQASRLDSHLSPARCARHPASTRTSLEAAELLLGRAVTPGESAPQTWSEERGARSEERGARSEEDEEDDGSGSAPPRSRRSRVPADREVGRFEEGPWTGGSGRHGVPGIPPRRAPLSGTVCQASRLDAHLSRSGRAPARPGGHARRSAPQTWSEEQERGARSEERGGRRIGQRTAAIATLSRPGRPGGRPLRGRAVDGRQWAARCARHPASTRTSLRHGVPGIPPRRAPLSGTVCQASRLDAHLSRSGRAPARPGGHARRSAPQTWSEERGARRTTTIGQRTAAIATLSRPGRPGGRPLRGRARGRAAVGGTVCQASRLDAHLSRSGRAPARPGGHARRERTAGVEREARSEKTRNEERGGRRIGQRTAAIATLSRPGRPGGRPLRGRARGRAAVSSRTLPQRPGLAVL